MSKVLIEFLWFFDPVETGWTTYDQIEGFLGKSFAVAGLEGENVQTIGGATSRKIILIKKKQEIAPLTVPSGAKPSKAAGGIKEQLAGLKLPPLTDKKVTEKGEKFKKGRYLKTKDYLKK